MKRSESVVRQKQALEKRERHAPHLCGLTTRGRNFSMWGEGGGGVRTRMNSDFKRTERGRGEG